MVVLKVVLQSVELVDLEIRNQSSLLITVINLMRNYIGGSFIGIYYLHTLQTQMEMAEVIYIF